MSPLRIALGLPKGHKTGHTDKKQIDTYETKALLEDALKRTGLHLHNAHFLDVRELLRFLGQVPQLVHVQPAGVHEVRQSPAVDGGQLQRREVRNELREGDLVAESSGAGNQLVDRLQMMKGG